MMADKVALGNGADREFIGNTMREFNTSSLASDAPITPCVPRGCPDPAVVRVTLDFRPKTILDRYGVFTGWRSVPVHGMSLRRSRNAGTSSVSGALSDPK